jgi:hypothetical protein
LSENEEITEKINKEKALAQSQKNKTIRKNKMKWGA